MPPAGVVSVCTHRHGRQSAERNHDPRNCRRYPSLKSAGPGARPWVWGAAGGLRICNLLTQDGERGRGNSPGRATLSHLKHCLEKLRAELEKGEVTSLAMLRLSTGVGRLQWTDVQPLIVHHPGDLKIPVFLHATCHRGRQGPEAGL